MTRPIAPLLLSLLLAAPAVGVAVTPAVAQSDAPLADPPANEGPGLDGFSDRAREFFGEMFENAEPALREIGPMLRELQAMIGDVTDYHMPEKLPNGDIIIRRRTPQEVTPGDDVPDAVPGLPDPPPGQSIDL
ncbi:hypothetical protein [Frigidibacter sp. MR17.24]|uniref:hypothetical protein n=1 Tax=Frigidibacter sp. MR17.24 TaxID=3127345 RepID=UPI0030130939